MIQLVWNGKLYNSEKSEISLKDYLITVKAKEFGIQTYRVELKRSEDYYNTSKVALNINFEFRWINKVETDSSEEIKIPDENLKKELLKNYDIDKDKKITKNDLINIETLEISNKSIKDLTGLENAENLTCIEASHNEITSLEPLRNLNRLSSAFLNYNKIIDIEPIKNVGYGWITNNYIEDITPFAEHDNYMNIDLLGNYIDVSEGTANRKMLEKDENTKFYIEFFQTSQKYAKSQERSDVLNIKENMKKKLIEYGVDSNNDGNITKGEMNDFNSGEMSREGAMFSECKIDLSNLGLTDNDIQCLKYLNCITELDLSNNKLTDVSPLKYIGSLTVLNLSNNKINIATLKEIDTVIDLDLSYNGLEDISEIGNLIYEGPIGGWFAGGRGGRETIINLSHNSIKDVSVINNINNVRLIDLSYNQITNIDSLEKFKFNQEDENYLEPFTIDFSYNYIEAGDEKAKAIVQLFKKYNATVITSNQFIKLVDEKSNVQIETLGDITAKIEIEEIKKDSQEYEDVVQEYGNSEVLYAADISIVEGEHKGKLSITIPLDTKFNGKRVMVLHKKANGIMEEFNKWVQNGNVVIEVNELSPFYVVYNRNQILPGDVNKDGKITLADYTKILAHVKKTKLLTEEEQKRADVNQDGKVTLADYTKVLAHVKKTKMLE